MSVAVVWWAAVCAAGVGVAGQRPPCYQCEIYRDAHPYPAPYTTVRGQCPYPCECRGVPGCRTGVPLVQDGCGCCWRCAGQAGEACHPSALCDTTRNLTCLYTTSNDLTGTCHETVTVGCSVNNRTYQSGQTFTPDCRTQCTCQNGTYACVSLCPNEALLPSAQCHNPHLISLSGRCCREWMCDAAPDKTMGPPACDRVSGRWSQCSVQSCGAGVSIRWSTDNPHCHLANQTRLCQLRPCNYRGGVNLQTQSHVQFERKHHIRRGHQCKATLRSERAVRLRVGWCVSERHYKPKMCAACSARCCTVHTSTTISIPFLCPLHANTNLLALPHARHPVLQDSQPSRPRPHIRQVTTHTPSVYDMMDEGQPVSEAVLSYPRPQPDEALTYDVNLDDNDDMYNDDDWDGDTKFEHENLWMEDDILYDDIKRDNYETIHYQVEWILRCKCASTCATQDFPSDTPSPPLTDTRHDPPLT